jgi:pimeloyl-ACP methyl ester carboxylesterase
MPYARNALDGSRVYFEDDGGPGEAVVFHGGLLDSVETVRGSHVARALRELSGEFRLIYADHRGLGWSDKPYEVEAYTMPLRVADAVAILDELGIGRAHFIGASYGGRLGFGIGEHAPERVLSLVIGGQQPYAIDRGGPLGRVVTEALADSRKEGSMEPFVRALEAFSGVRFSDALREKYLDNDPVAVEAASNAMVAEGAISGNLRTWQIRCLIYAGTEDVDFIDRARRAADEIPNAEFVPLEGLEHVDAHLVRVDRLLLAILRTLRGKDR